MTLPTTQGLERVRELAAANRNLAVVVTTHPQLTDPHVALVNAAVVGHPSDGRPVLGFVGRRGAKLDNLRANPRATLVFQYHWEWVAVRGPVELAGPDDPHPAIDANAQRALLRSL